jgi:hypothetical protein
MTKPVYDLTGRKELMPRVYSSEREKTKERLNRIITNAHPEVGHA